MQEFPIQGWILKLLGFWKITHPNSRAGKLNLTQKMTHADRGGG